MEDEAQPNPIGPTPWRFFGDFLGVQKVTRRRGDWDAKITAMEPPPFSHILRLYSNL